MSDPPHLAAGALAAAQAAQASAESIADALKVTELRYRRLFEAARDGILLLDSQTGQITDANPFMAELLGYSHAEFLGKELWEIGLLKDKKTSQDAFLKLQRDHYIRYESIPLETRAGDRRDVEFVSNLYRENGHTVIQCNIRDITDRKTVEHLLATAAARNERIAETLQRSMLQASPTGMFSGLEVETLYAAALNEAEVGGDFFDAFALSPEKVALVVGDVSGKGLLAAGRTAEVKYALRAFLHENHTPALALTHLNDFICESHRTDANAQETFIVLGIAVLNPYTGEVTFSAAGAEPSIILRESGLAEAIEIVGTPLGVQPGESYVEVTTTLLPGETILMATDGITEARHGKDFLGSEGMRALAEEHGNESSLLELTQSIYRGARLFAQGPLRDDVCLLLARRQ
ncbi:MAG TPA: SpoIIE family protein phosphatase [Capsulimonadaceae bacterium]|jgi:PAS domain S-box-containing protein